PSRLPDDHCSRHVYYCTGGPRSREKTAVKSVSPEKTRRACWRPGRKLATVPYPVCRLVTRFGLPIMLISLPYDTSAVMMAITSGMLATILVLMIVALTAEDIPLFEAGTEPMTELALGLLNS